MTDYDLKSPNPYACFDKSQAIFELYFSILLKIMFLLVASFSSYFEAKFSSSRAVHKTCLQFFCCSMYVFPICIAIVFDENIVRKKLTWESNKYLTISAKKNS